MRGWSGWNCHRTVVNKCDEPLHSPIMTVWPNGTTHIPASINVFHAIIWSQVQQPVTHQLQSTCAKSMEIQWRRAENHASSLLPKKEKSLAESNKGWEEDALVQGSKVGGQRPSKSRTVWRWNALKTYYWGERKTTSHNCLGDGKPFRLPGKWRPTEEKETAQWWLCGWGGGEGVKGEAARPLTSGRQTWSRLRMLQTLTSALQKGHEDVNK